jgi:hypothetical protein
MTHLDGNSDNDSFLYDKEVYNPESEPATNVESFWWIWRFVPLPSWPWYAVKDYQFGVDYNTSEYQALEYKSVYD